MMDCYMKANIIFCLLSLATASPPSQQDIGLCSQIYTMHQYCTRQMSPTSTGVTHRPTVQPRVGEAGPVGPRERPGIVNYTAIEEKIAAKYLDLEARIDEKFERLKGTVVARLERSDTEIEKIRNDTTKDSKSIEATPKRTPISPTGTNWSSCDDVPRSNHESRDRKGGIFNISRGATLYEVYCDLTTDGGGWTVLQRRMDGTVDFYRNWEEYARGFGDKSGEFWLGLEAVYQLTRDGAYELRVDLTDWDGSTAYAKYGTFSITRRSDNYRLTVGAYYGTAGDSLAYDSNNLPFSAKNKDLDGWPNNCATLAQAGWWFKACSYSSLNGRYNDTSGSNRGIYWYHWKQRDPYSLKASEMKFRKK